MQKRYVIMAKADLQFVLSLTVSQLEKAIKQAEKAVSGMGSMSMAPSS